MGWNLIPGIDVGGGDASKSDGKDGGSWHVHWYIYPLIYWLELIVDFLCLEQMSFDIFWITEIDPLWQDDALTFLLNPEAILFGNPIAQAACAADCVKSTSGLPFGHYFGCSGCQGGMYPLRWYNTSSCRWHSIRAACSRGMCYKNHRELLAWGTSGSTNDKICSKYVMPIMKKSQYRSQLQCQYQVIVIHLGELQRYMNQVRKYQLVERILDF